MHFFHISKKSFEILLLFSSLTSSFITSVYNSVYMTYNDMTLFFGITSQNTNHQLLHKWPSTSDSARKQQISTIAELIYSCIDFVRK